MNIGIITTSRADFGIYKMLIDTILKEKDIELFIFAGGMHTSKQYGATADLIETEGYVISERLAPLENDDSPPAITVSMSNTLKSYGSIWKKYQETIDLMFVLGDRFEMFAAASSLIPFNISIAHLHGGEITLGAIDNKFRYAISALSDYHFASSEEHANNLKKFIESRKVFNVGSLGIEAASKAELFSKEEFEERFQVNIEEGFILTTYHPETVKLNNQNNSKELIEAFKRIPEKVLCTLPNADTEGGIIREALLTYEKESPEKIVCFENLGQKGYYSAMNYCTMMIGNTSSGIIESTAFNKWVVNVGDRQKGRQGGNNVITVANERNAIFDAYQKLRNQKESNFEKPFGDGNTANKIIEIIRQEIKNDL